MSTSSRSSRGSVLVSAGILVSRLTGLVRERAIGHFLGTSFAADAFTVAFRLPNLLQHLLGEGVLSASFIPVYSRLLGEGREREAGRVAGAVLGLLLMVTGLAVVVGVVLAEPLTTVVAAGLRGRPETFDLTVRLVRLLFPAVGLLVVSAWCLGVLNSHRRFFLSYVAPAVLNVTQVAVLVAAGLAVAGPDVDVGAGGFWGGFWGVGRDARLVTWLAMGTVVGGLAQVLVQVPTVVRVAREVRPNLQWRLPGVVTTVRSFVPVVSARGVVQVSTFVHVFLASFLAAGALATLRYGQILYGLPISLFGMAVAAAELPELSRESATIGDRAADRLAPGLARIAAFVVPTAMGYLVLGDVLVAAVFQSGQFDRLDTRAVWLVLGGYSLGLVASTSSRLLQSALYGVGDPRTPSRVAIIRVLVSATVGVALMFSFDRVAVTTQGLAVVGSLPALAPLPAAARVGVAGSVRIGAVGLALGAAVSAWVEYVLLRRAVTRQLGPVRLGGGQLRAIVAATGGAGLVAGLARVAVADWPPVVAAVVAVAAAAATYATLCRWLGVVAVRHLLAAVRRRLVRA